MASSDFHRLTSRFKQFGGLRLIREYWRLGVFGTAVKAFFRCFLKRESFKRIYPSILNKVGPYLRRKYTPLMRERKVFYAGQELSHQRSKLVWWCWLQGFDAAPDIVKACYRSIKKHLTDREIIIVDAENWREYVDLPDYIVRRWEKKQIPPALFADLLRLELLVCHGGTWIDSTVLCTGREHTQDYLDTDLFLFQYTRPGSKEFGGISNWFITACTNNEALLTLRDMLYAYWRDYDCTLDYYIFHLFFSMLLREYPGQIAAMPYGYSRSSLVLLHMWRKPFDQEKWDQLVSQVSFHKLAFRHGSNIEPRSYYCWIVNSQ